MIYILIIFFMFLKPQKLSSLLVIYPVIIMPLLNIGLTPFFVKAYDRREVLLQGRCVDKLYPLASSSTFSLGHHVHAAKSSSSLWHRYLGYPSSIMVHQVLHANSILFSESNKDLVCDACQMTKSHQLTYPRSTSVSTSPLACVL
jgi:hypothetical protein